MYLSRYDSIIAKFSTNLFALAILLGALSSLSVAQTVKEVIPPPTTPGTRISNLNSSVGYVRAKASADECWTGMGMNPRWAFINTALSPTGCLPTQVPKVDQGYIWGTTVVGSQIFFGSFANAECLGFATSNSNPTPVYIKDYWSCEFTNSAYATTHGGPLPPALGDFRPPRMYIYDIPTKTIRDITPKLPAAAAPTLCATTGNDAICTDPLWNTMVGVRSATTYVEPTTNKAYVFVSGQALVNGPSQNAVNFYIWGVTENRWVAKYQYVGYADIRRWVSNQGVLYAAAFKPTPNGGSLLRYTGSLATVPGVGNPQTNAGSTILSCGTSSVNPPTPTGVCIRFDDVGDFDTPGSEVVVAPAGTADAGRFFVGTWPPTGSNPNNAVGGVFMSPVVPAGGLTTAAAGQWTKVWNYGNYEPDPTIKSTYGTGGMTFYNGYLYWGSLNPILAGANRIFNLYGRPTDPATVFNSGARASRTAVLFRAQNFSSGTPTVDLLYGEAQLPVYTPANPNAVPPTPESWALLPNNVPSNGCTTACGTPALFGHSGFDNVWTDYMWSMAVVNSRLYVGTMSWEFLAAANNGTNPLPMYATPQPSHFGASLYYFNDTSTAAIPLSTNGMGNYLNYGIRNIIPYSPTSFFVGIANPMSLAAGAVPNWPGAPCNVPSGCRGGWELIEINPSSTVISR